jgi:hypothetical protein
VHKRAYLRAVKPLTPVAALVGLAGDAEPSRQRQVSGPVFFGFGLPQVQQAIQQMPGAAKLLGNIDSKVSCLSDSDDSTTAPVCVGVAYDYDCVVSRALPVTAVHRV